MPTGTGDLPTDWREWPLEAKRRLRDTLRERIRPRWTAIARPAQLPPTGNWFVWLILAGRGWGKTRTGAEWVAEKARRYPDCRIALVAQSFTDGRDTMVEGESGLLSVLGEHELRGGSIDTAWNRSLGELFLANGSRFKIYSSEKPRQLRGPQHHFAWGDEPATWYDASKGPMENTTWSNLVFGCRLTVDGSSPQVVVTGTPKPVRLLTKRDEEPLGLLHRPSTVITRGHTDENLSNLAPAFRVQVVDPVRGTRLGRQELAAEILEDAQDALWKRTWFDAEGFRVDELPYPGSEVDRAAAWQRMPIVGVDPSDGTEDGAEHAYTVIGLGMDHRLYVVENDGLRVSPYSFACEVIQVARRWGAMIVVEKNHGGQWLVEVFERAMRDLGVRVPLKVVSAAQGKRTRAEPVAALYEQGHFRHVGEHPELEDQMANWTGAAGELSPDRLDSLVWAASEFTGLTFGPPVGDGGAVPYEDRSEAVAVGGAVPYSEPEGAVAWT